MKKKRIITNSIIIILFISIFILLIYTQYKTYTKNFNKKIIDIYNIIVEKYPEVSKNDIIEILNSTTKLKNREAFKEYGIEIDEDSLVLVNKQKFIQFIFIDVLILMFFIAIIYLLFYKYNKERTKKIEKITQYISEINNGNYKLKIEENREDEISILQNELYKTTVMLREVAENSKNDKINLKNSLSDISHQLKTPLTAITIMADNIIENKDMEPDIREEFMKDIRRETTNIKFLVESLLKLSKLDSNSVKFINEKVKVKEIIEEAVKKISPLSDLKNVMINTDGNETDEIECDKKWQIEAITNVLKNCIEHSNDNSSINIKYEQNNMYTKIEIQDFGSGITAEDLPHIFERFYKGKNSSSESIGIGLALAKSIIENNNGYISVESEIGKGSKFTIKYIRKIYKVT